MYRILIKSTLKKIFNKKEFKETVSKCLLKKIIIDKQ